MILFPHTIKKQFIPVMLT